MTGVLRRIRSGLRSRNPRVSIVVIVYDMPRQAANTVRSLLPGYQSGVADGDYEVIIVENESPNTMDPAFLSGLPGCCRYFLRTGPEPSPAAAINFGVRQAKSAQVCVMVDGARMLTPGVVRQLIQAHRLHDQAVVAVPGYHLGRELQQTAVGTGYDGEVEQALLTSIDWPANGYGLFDIACFSGSCRGGFFLPFSESNCVSVTRATWDDLEGFDERFDLPGGGLINLDFYRRACEYPGTNLVVLPGEGSFHQFHGGITTGGTAQAAREDYIARSRDQYQRLRGMPYSSPRVPATYLGAIPHQAQKFVHLSSVRVLQSRGELPLENKNA